MLYTVRFKAIKNNNVKVLITAALSDSPKKPCDWWLVAVTVIITDNMKMLTEVPPF